MEDRKIQNFNEHQENMKDLKFSWSISTIKIFLDNTNESKAPELMYDKEYLTHLVNDLKTDHKEMFIDFGDKDETVKKYFVAINEIGGWIPNCG